MTQTERIQSTLADSRKTSRRLEILGKGSLIALALLTVAIFVNYCVRSVLWSSASNALKSMLTRQHGQRRIPRFLGYRFCSPF